MHIDAKRELARLILETHDVRERSWDLAARRYRLTVWDAVEISVADEDLQLLVHAIVTVINASGFCEFTGWASLMLAVPVGEPAGPAGQEASSRTSGFEALA